MRHSLCYVSTCKANLSEEEIDNILVQSKVLNTKNRISGILIYSEGNFFQILEGSKKEVQHLYARIQSDHRHHSLIKIFQRDLTDMPNNLTVQEFTAISGKKFKNKALQKYLSLTETIHDKKNYASTSYLIHKFIYGETRQVSFPSSNPRESETSGKK